MFKKNPYKEDGNGEFPETGIELSERSTFDCDSEVDNEAEENYARMHWTNRVSFQYSNAEGLRDHH